MLSVYLRPWTLDPTKSTKRNPLLSILGKCLVTTTADIPAWTQLTALSSTTRPHQIATKNVCDAERSQPECASTNSANAYLETSPSTAAGQDPIPPAEMDELPVAASRDRQMQTLTTDDAATPREVKRRRQIKSSSDPTTAENNTKSYFSKKPTSCSISTRLSAFV